jgi:hypothetical protein
MERGGVFAVDRGVFDHPIFAPEPYTEREAWLWLISAAVWKDTRARVGRHIIELRRGQCAFALRFLAGKWKWAESRVRRFLKRLETDAMIVVSATREATQVTICNYDRYAFGRRNSDAQNDAQTDEPPTHPRRKEEEGKELNKKGTRAAPGDSPEFEEFWKAYPKRKGSNPKHPAKLIFLSAVKAGTDPKQIIAAVRAGIGYDADNIGSQFIPRADKWLRQKSYQDYLDGSEADSARRAEYYAAAEAKGYRLVDGKWVPPDKTVAA